MNQIEKDALLRAIAHLESMKERAVIINPLGNPICVYHGESGQKCAVGVLITAEAYTPDVEGTALCESEIIEGVLEKSLGVKSISFSFFDALAELQDIHDTVGNWGMKGFEPMSRDAHRLARIKELANA